MDRAALSRIPKPSGPRLPVIGHTAAFARDPLGYCERLGRVYGPVYRIHAFGRWTVILMGAEALEMIFLDREQNFSSSKGWLTLQKLFPNGLLLRDFDDHRVHRRIMQVCFKPKPMADYVDRMNDRIDRALDDWPTDTAFPFYRKIKALTLDLGAAVFLGVEMGKDAERINRAFIDELSAAASIIRVPIPGNRFWRGARARAFLLEFFGELIRARRDGEGADMVSHLCRARSEEGESFADQEIVDHLNLLLMASHDTTTSALTTMMWALAAYPDWQETLRDEARRIGGRIDHSGMALAENTERVFKEALRLRPPLPILPRYALRPFAYAGRTVPGETWIDVCPGLVSRDPDLWTDPLSFDPDRFLPERAEDQRHRFAWSPFGGGAHKCLGMHFATMQTKAVTVQLLQRYRVTLPEGYEPRWKHLPIPRPADGLPITLRRL